MKTPHSILSFALMALVACGGDPTTVEGPGTFSATITGGADDEFSGRAVFGTTEQATGDSALVLSLISTDSINERPDHAILLVDPGARDLATGTNPLLNYHEWTDTSSTQEVSVPYGIYADPQGWDGAGITAVSGGGEVSLTEMNGERITGTFDFPVLGILVRNTGVDTFSARLTGSFEAIPGTPETQF